MYQNLLADSSLYRFLVKLDADLAAQCRDRGCSCGGKLHSAKYPRKPRGLPQGLDADYAWRHSFCCAREGCRSRSTPASFRFLGRTVFVAAVMVLVSTLRHGTTPARITQLQQLVGVSRRTVQRWVKWWQQDFTRSAFWKEVQGRLPKPVDVKTLPLSLLEVFCSTHPKTHVVELLRLLLPLSAPRPGRAF